MGLEFGGGSSGQDVGQQFVGALAFAQLPPDEDEVDEMVDDIEDIRRVEAPPLPSRDDARPAPQPVVAAPAMTVATDSSVEPELARPRESRQRRLEVEDERAAAEPPTSEPSDPEPSDPEPSDLEPSDPAQPEPEPSDLEQPDPEPSDPEPSDLEPSDLAPAIDTPFMLDVHAPSRVEFLDTTAT